jgi:ABC-type branched-subunit amino acid transport system permease subunit
MGFGGLLSFGHAMFLGTAGYAAAHAAKVWGWNPELAVLFATACSTLLALVVGLLAIRRQGIYFAMITLAFSQMVFFFACKRLSQAVKTASSRCLAASCLACLICPTTRPCTCLCWRFSWLGFLP